MLFTVLSVPVYESIEIPPAPVQGDAFDTNGPRLMITHIVNEDFKSYAGIQSLGPFHKVACNKIFNITHMCVCVCGVCH